MSDAADTTRLEAFSDGVFAIAITLLVLDIKVPGAHALPPHTSLLRALGEQWPVYLAYVTSFLTILVTWVNHHRLFRHIRRVDDGLLIRNGLLLMGVTLLPFPTSLLAEYIQQPGARTAAAVYAGVSLFMALGFNRMWRYASHQNRLIDPERAPQQVQRITDSYRFGPLLYGVAFALAFVSVAASVGMCLLLAVYFALPQRPARE